MRILIMSDSHNKTYYFDEMLEHEKKFDLCFHCGDGASDLEYFEARLDCPVRLVTGNCDFFASRQFTIDTELEGRKIHVEHGQRLPYRSDSEMLDFATVNGYNVVLFGHTHCQKILNRGDYWVVNPGSISNPRDGGRPSYVVMETDGEGNFRFEGKRI